MKTLKELFNEYKTDSDHHEHCQKWFGHYKAFYEEIHQCKSIQDDMLEKLLLKNDNWITTCGLCFLKKDNYENLRDDSEFRQTLDQFLNESSFANYKALEKVTADKLKEYGAQGIPLRIKRIACAFNSKLSIYCSNNFEKALDQMEPFGYVKLQVKTPWFKRNLEFTAWLDEALGHVTGDDIYYRNIFLWELWGEKLRKADKDASKK